MKIIKAVLFEPVGCLAEFPPDEFDEIATSVFDADDACESGSEAYWRLLGLIEASGSALTPAHARIAEALELRAVERVQVYEDVGPALAELQSMDVALVVASSLSAPAIARFLDKFALNDYFSAVWSRDNAGGIKAGPLVQAIQSASCPPDQIMVLVDTTDSIDVAKEVGANAILMINDYDEGKRLAAHAPAGGIVSLHELPDAIRLVAEGAKSRRS